MFKKIKLMAGPNKQFGIFTSGKWLLLTFFCLITISSCLQNNSDALVIGNEAGQLEMLRVTGRALSPTFEITQKHYVSTADYSVTKIGLQVWGKQTDTDISINGQPLKNQDEFGLAVGNNQFTISISTKQKIIDQYQLTVVRLPERNFKHNS